MTAEIAVMNKRAIALAADSAVTVGDRAKFYNTANKLFMLSKYEPVGIMVYNNAEFMGIPWETIVKEFRLYLGRTYKDYLQDYAECFFEFLLTKQTLFKDFESMFYQMTVFGYLKAIKDSVMELYSQKVEELGRKLEPKELSELVISVVNDYYGKIESAPSINDVPDGLCDKISVCFEKEFKELTGSFVEFSFLDKDSNQKLMNACSSIFIKDIFVDVYSGIVIAGFGRMDTFPVLISYNVAGYISGFLKKNVVKLVKISNSQDYQIIPFAQKDTVLTFLFGVNERYLRTLDEYFYETIINKISQMDDNIFKRNGKSKLKNELQTKWKEVMDGINTFSQKEYLTPILKAIRVSPIDELASMAESLVNLTSFRRQVSLDEYSYTVGGPVDVAVISKGDGFVWIKRKHYFKPELNHHFFNNYFLDDSEERDDEK
jgi:hypothetical protein